MNITIEVAEDMQGKGEIAALDPSQESEKTRSGSSIAVLRMQMMNLIPWISTMMSSMLLLTLTLLLLFLLTSKHFKSVTFSAKFPLPAGQRSNDASDSDEVHTDAYYANSDKVVSDEDGNPAYTTRSVAHSDKQSMFTDKNRNNLTADDRSILSHLAPKVRKSASIASLSEECLRTYKTLLLGRRIKIYFPDYGGSWGKVIECDVLKDLYKLEFSVDGETHYISFEDVLKVLPRFWFGRKARAHQVRVVQSLLRAAHAACFLSIGRKPMTIVPLLSDFTEPGDYAMCCKAPDYEKWLEAMIKEIKELENMGCWKIVKLTSLPPGAKLINCRWVYKLKIRDGTSERHRARLVAMGYQQEKGRDYFESFSPTCSHSTVRLALALTAVPGWYSLDLDAVCAFISSDLAPGERVYMKGPADYNIGEGDCMYMLKCINGLV